MTKKVKHVRYLSIGAYSKDADGILVIVSPKGPVRLPRKRITDGHVLRFGNETWLRDSVASIMKEQTGIGSFIKDGKNIPIATGVQRMPAIYSIASCRETSSSIIIKEEFAFILGKVDYASLKNPFVFFIKLNSFKEFVKKGKINLSQQFSMLRMLASRDNPDRIEAEKAGLLLRELQEKNL